MPDIYILTRIIFVTFSRLGINQVWLPILLVVSWTEILPVSVRAWELGLASLVRTSRPALARSFSTPRLNLVLTYGTLLPLSLSATVSIRTAMRHRASPEFIRSRNCVSYWWRSLPGTGTGPVVLNRKESILGLSRKDFISLWDFNISRYLLFLVCMCFLVFHRILCVAR